MRVAVITYDTPAVLKHFADRRGITYPLLSDAGSATIRAFGILNTNVPAGPFHGVPFPGTYVVDAKGVVRSKYFEEDYRERVSAGAMLVREFNTISGPRMETRTDHLTLRTSASNATVYTGSRIALIAEIELPKGMHLYAPGVEGGYKPVGWEMDASKSSLALPVSFPPARRMHLKAIKETVPVYENRIRLTRDLVVGQANELGPALKEGRMTVEGKMLYQACDARVCYTPQVVPLKWTFAIQEPDRTRTPAALRTGGVQ
ncbi:MAG: peroxiredoxin family protein [Acidobacteria bacterium]|nr:peroxiredoxin family protein [Acidobacteriota bacterium]